MIPNSYIIEWAKFAPWADPLQIEQDLIITKALLDLYTHDALSKNLAFRGGTALNKLIFNPPSRYSEDIDLVQINNQPIGPTINSIRDVMDNWLGQPKRDFGEGCITLSYRVTSNDGRQIKLKIEINTREHFSILGFRDYAFTCNSTWCSGEVNILGYRIEELLGTKMRALYQRRKGRDLYDLYMALTALPDLNTDDVIKCFKQYIEKSNHAISRKDFLTNLESKLKNKEFKEDILPLLPRHLNSFDSNIAFDLIKSKLIDNL